MRVRRQSFGNAAFRGLASLCIALLITALATDPALALTTHQGNAAAAATPLALPKQPHTLVVGSEQDFPPFSTGMTDQDAGGFTVDLWQAVAAENHLPYTLRVRPFHLLLEEFKAGKIDVLINLAMSEERHKFVDFTVPHVTVHGAIFTRSDQHGIQSEDDLAGKSIIVIKADLAHDYALDQGWGPGLVLVDTAAEGLQELANGQHDAMLLSKLTGLQTQQKLGLVNLRALPITVGFSQKFAFATQPHQADLLAQLNEGLALTKANGLYNSLYEKWFGLYETKEVGLRDLLKYIGPVVALFVLLLGFLFYRRQVERNLAFAATAQSRNLMRNILDNIPVGLSAFDKDLKLIAYNRMFQDTLDFPDALFRGASTSFEHIIRFNADRKEYGEGDHEQMVQTIIERARQPVVHQFERVRPNGVTLEVRGAPMPGGGFVTTYADISERKRVEAVERRLSAQLRLDEERSHDFSLSASDWFWETDVEHRFCYFSNSFEKIYGQSQDLLLGKNRQEVLVVDGLNPPESINPHLAQLQAHLPFKNFEYQVRTTNGPVIWVSVSGLPHRDAQGRFAGYRGTGTLISERKAIEETLRQALQSAQAATVAKSRFLATMSHEIRTPMNGILGMAQLLLMPTLQESQRLDYARTILTCGKSLLTLLNDILDLSKIEAGKLQLDRTAFAPELLLQETRTLFWAAGQDKGLQLDSQWLGAPGQRYLADAHRLRQMLSNLAGNAVKFTQQGSVRIEGKAVQDQAGAALLEFSVRDTGIGIPADKLELLFKPFSQTDSSITRQYGGSGLGLSIVSNLAQAMGGAVGVDSVVGVGSRFWFRVPVAPLAEGEESRSAARSVLAEARPAGALKALDLPLFLKLVDQITPLLEQNLFDSIDRFKELQALLDGTALAAEAREIAAQIARLHFDLALQHLRRLAHSQTVGRLP